MTRNIGDHIRFQVMPWFFRTNPIYEGTITEVCEGDEDTGIYYHVNAIINGKHVEDGMILEREVVQEDQSAEEP